MDTWSCREIFLSLLWKQALEQGNPSNCLTWSTFAREELGLSSLEGLGLLQAGSFPLCFNSHKYFSFSGIHQNALQDICVCPNIPPGSKQCPFWGRNCSISVLMDFTTRDKISLSPLLPFNLLSKWGDNPTLPFSLQPGKYLHSPGRYQSHKHENLLYFPSTPAKES